MLTDRQAQNFGLVVLDERQGGVDAFIVRHVGNQKAQNK
jgi:hypothetical protein